MNRCETCANWRRKTEEFDINYHGPHAGDCSHEAFVYDGGKVGEAELHYWDYESYSAGFMTGAKFGCCVHHKPRED